MSDQQSAREVIARALHRSPDSSTAPSQIPWDDLPRIGWSGSQTYRRKQADAIIAALDAAGWCLVRKDGRDHLIRTMEKNGVYLTAELDYADDAES